MRRYWKKASPTQLFHPQKGKQNSSRIIILAKPKHQKENLEKEKAIIGLFSEVGRPSFIDAHRRPRFKRT